MVNKIPRTVYIEINHNFICFASLLTFDISAKLNNGDMFCQMIRGGIITVKTYIKQIFNHAELTDKKKITNSQNHVWIVSRNRNK